MIMALKFFLYTYQTRRLVLIWLNKFSNLHRVWTKRQVIKRYLIDPRKCVGLINIRDFIGPFTRSCEAQPKSFPSIEQIQSLAEVQDTVSGPTQFFLLDVVADPVAAKGVQSNYQALRGSPRHSELVFRTQSVLLANRIIRREN